MRMSYDGFLLYANVASLPVRRAWGVDVGDRLPSQLFERLREAAAGPADNAVEVEHGNRTYSVLAVDVPDLGFVNLYGTDVTAAKVITKFPDQNPNPVLRVSGGRLIYANAASRPIVEAHGLVLGQPVPAALRGQIDDCLAGRRSGPIGVMAGPRTYELLPVEIPEFGFANLYGTDVTAARAITKFPDQNPNPVLRVSDGILIYANRASQPIVEAQHLVVGEPVPQGWADAIAQRLGDADRRPIEVPADDLTFELLPVAVPEFGFINLYGTDVTAARMVAEANRENERLLLNILPPPIADRLRRGERVIADRFDDVTMLIADIVGFTELSSGLSATELVEMLNGIFSACDELVDRHGLEKVKTIGDAYMVVGGLPTPIEDHLARVADFALDLTDTVRRMQEGQRHRVSVRIGIHSGPVVAGVIGVKKFIYDVWGDTVNQASRMEALGVPGRIHVTGVVRDRLADRYEFEPRGIMEVKGKGPMATWFLTGRAAG